MLSTSAVGQGIKFSMQRSSLHGSIKLLSFHSTHFFQQIFACQSTICHVYSWSKTEGWKRSSLLLGPDQNAVLKNSKKTLPRKDTNLLRRVDFVSRGQESSWPAHAWKKKEEAEHSIFVHVLISSKRTVVICVNRGFWSSCHLFDLGSQLCVQL